MKTYYTTCLSRNIIYFTIYLGIPYTLIIFPSIFSQVCQPTISLQVPKCSSLTQFVLALYSLEPGQTPTGLPLKEKWLLPQPSCEGSFKNSLQYIKFGLVFAGGECGWRGEVGSAAFLTPHSQLWVCSHLYYCKRCLPTHSSQQLHRL